jgi:predicted ABC-type ATPase
MSRLRVIAGPNGSGKSSVFQIIKEFKEKEKIIPIGPFVNSDLIEKAFRETGYISLKDFEITSPSPTIIQEYLAISSLKEPYEPAIIKDLIVLENDQLKLAGSKSSPRIGMIVSDLIREELLRRQISFTMETVFSHQDKVLFMQRAKDAGYKVYLYFVSTENPEINIKRVEGRVAAGGHDVDPVKIVERYKRTMKNLLAAVKISYRAYIFDNSGESTVKIAEKDKDGTLYFEESVPEWILRFLEVK